MTNPTHTGGDPITTWQRLSADATTAAPSVTACLAAASRLADQVWLTANPSLDPVARHGDSDSARWAATALAAYQHLHTTGAYGHLDVAVLLRCTADAARIRRWLDGPSDLPGFATATVADTWQVTDDEFHYQADGIGALMGTLVDQAQRAGVFGVPGYTISLRHLTPADTEPDPIIEHQVTLTGPSGAMFASAPIATDHLADDDLCGVDAAVAVLANTAAVVNELLVTEHHLLTGGQAPAPQPHRAQPSRGFTALDLTAPAITTPAIDPPGAARTDRHPRR